MNPRWMQRITRSPDRRIERSVVSGVWLVGLIAVSLCVSGVRAQEAAAECQHDTSFPAYASGERVRLVIRALEAPDLKSAGSIGLLIVEDGAEDFGDFASLDGMLVSPGALDAGHELVALFKYGRSTPFAASIQQLMDRSW